MGAGHVKKDSLSRCETPSMLYDAVRRPNPVYQSTTSVEKTKDTLAPNPNRKLAQKDIIDKLESKGLQLPHESYVAVVQVGKYMFLAIMLPVYLCCYSVPRWFLATALPYIYSGMKEQALNVGRHIFEKSKQVADLMKGVLDQLIGDALRTSKERGKNLWRHITRRAGRLSQIVRGYAKFLRNRSQDLRSKISDGSLQILEKAKQQANSTNQRAYKKVIDVGNRLYDRSLVAFQTFDRIALTPFMRAIVTPFNKLFSIIAFIKAKTAAIYLKLSAALKKAIDPKKEALYKALKAIKEWTLTQLKRLLQPISNWFNEKWTMICDYYKWFKEVFISPLIWLASWLYRKLKPWIKAVYRPFAKIFSFLAPAAKYIAKALWRAVPQRIKDKFSFKKRVSGIVENFKRTKSILFSGCLWSITFIKKTFLKIKRVLVASYRILRQLFLWTLRLLKLVFRFLFKICRFFGRIIARIAFVIHVVVAVFWISFVHGFELVRHLESRSVFRTR